MSSPAGGGGRHTNSFNILTGAAVVELDIAEY